jgi:hypothetical protein
MAEPSAGLGWINEIKHDEFRTIAERKGKVHEAPGIRAIK